MELTQKQIEAIQNKSRFKVLNWGRRAGKTTLFAYEALGTGLTIDKANITYYAQTFGDARDIAWKIFLDIFGNAVKSKNETLLEITLHNLKGGESYVRLKGWESVYQSGKGRGTENHLVLCDEIDFCPQFMDKFTEVIEPTILTTMGRAIFASTPRGYSHLYQLKVKSEQHEGWYYSHATCYDNPANSREEIERIKREITQEKFNQEYLAQFIRSEGSSVFKKFRECFTGKLEEPKDGHQYICGIDLARTQDRTVIIVADSHTNSVVHFEVMEKTPWSVQRRRIIETIIKYNNARTIIDATGVGDAFVDTLYATGLPIEAFKISGNAVKRGLVEKMQMFLENKYIILPEWKLLEEELDAFEYGVTSQGTITYSAPSGMNDDCIMSLALLIHVMNVNPTPYHLPTMYDMAIDKGYGVDERTGYIA